MRGNAAGFRIDSTVKSISRSGQYRGSAVCRRAAKSLSMTCYAKPVWVVSSTGAARSGEPVAIEAPEGSSTED
jgi:hypothetical protein